MEDPNKYEYKAGVRDKVKKFESRLASTDKSEEEDKPIVNVTANSSDSNINKLRKSYETSSEVAVSDFQVTSLKSKKVANTNKDEIIKKSNTTITASNPKPKELPPHAPTVTHLSKQVKPQPRINQIASGTAASKTVLESNSNPTIKKREQQIILTKVPTPAPRKFVQRLSLQNIAETELSDTDMTNSTSPSVSTTRRSSEDDGIADMATESDPFDDSNMPLPKVKDNAFLLKDKQGYSNKNESSEEPLLVLPPVSPRRASMIPQSSIEVQNEALKRTRTDSTNSAENYVFRHISSDYDASRRESQAEIKIDVLQSNKGGMQTGSPVRSPVVVRSKTLSNSAASILILGLPRAGKSALIDSLVQQNVTGSGLPSSPPEIVEYTAKIKILDSSNLFNLKIIDTPGFSNDPTITFDARCMSSLISYLDSSNGLRGKPPTIVLVVLRFDDKRLMTPEDEHPDIVNFLKLINNFQQNMNDGKYANFVFVLTHFLSGSSSDQERRKPQSKIVELINLIQKYTSLPPPIMVVCGENERSTSSTINAESKHETEENNNSASAMAVTLPNGETYPYNLIEKIKILLTKKGRDSVGETVLRTAFGIEYPYSIKDCKITQRIPLISASHQSVQQMQKTILHAYMDIERTEIFTLLEIGWENVQKDIRKKFPDSLYTVQQIFQTKKVKKFEDIPEAPVDVLRLVRQMPSNLAVKDLLIDTLQLKVPSCPQALFIGQGFDLCKDTTTGVSPFVFNSGLKTTPVGLVPNEFECKIRDDREICFKFFYSVEDYILERLKDLNLRYSISPNSLPALTSSSTSQQHWGYNIIKKNQEPTNTTVATAAIEYRVFQITLPQNSEVQFKPQFWDAVTEMPDMDIKDPSCVSAWKDFFGYWGTHVTKSAFGGGSVEVTFRGPSVLNKVFGSLKKEFILPSDEYETTRVFQWITGDGLDFVAYGKDLKNDFLHGYDVQAHFRGGDIRFQQVDLTKVDSKEMVANIREDWKESLVLNPVMLETSLVLVPISHYIREQSEDIATKVDVALHYFYSDFMVSQGKPSSCTLL
ncbi:unnamed protein product [Orchesella dallaii]|uniref:MACPF domain-containing protein n=1 Tax=Orchesella dallaii TaxID=48710 RepID=A0ABP1Q9M4_9HEXA